ncbi:MAG: hypothetical protein ACI4IR_10095 [Eubacterium sp.]
MNEDRCVCCGNYVPEGRMICTACETKSNNQTHFAPQKRHKKFGGLIAFIFGVLICFSFGVLSGQALEKETNYEHIVVDIETSDGSFISTLSDAVIHYNGEIIEYITINNNTLLAYELSDNYDSGVYLIEGVSFEKLKSDLQHAKKNLENGNTELTKEYLNEISDFTETQTVYDYCPT